MFHYMSIQNRERGEHSATRLKQKYECAKKRHQTITTLIGLGGQWDTLNAFLLLLFGCCWRVGVGVGV